MVVKAGQVGVVPAAPAGLSALDLGIMEPATSNWVGLSAAALHAASGRTFTAAHYAEADRAADQPQRTVGTWISSWEL